MSKNVIPSVSDVVDSVDRSVDAVVRETDKMVEPVRRSAFKRFPVLFTILVTFGVASTFFGFEHLIVQVPLLVERPLVALGIGITTLVITGTLYKKLG